MWHWIGLWLCIAIGGAISLFLVGRNTWRHFSLLLEEGSAAAETVGEVGDRIGEASAVAEAVAEQAARLTEFDPVIAQARVVELREVRAGRRDQRHRKHIAIGSGWQPVNDWLSVRQAQRNR